MIIIPEEEGEFEQRRKRKNKSSSLRIKGKVMAESKVVSVIKNLKKLY